jgi:hypothetical protein
MGNDGHVTDIGRLVHQRPDLFDREAVRRRVSEWIYHVWGSEKFSARQPNAESSQAEAGV